MIVLHCLLQFVSLLGRWSCGKGLSPTIVRLTYDYDGIAEPWKVFQRIPVHNVQISCVAKVDSLFFRSASPLAPLLGFYLFPKITGS